MSEKAVLALEDGKVFRGYRFGHGQDGEGEVVFGTGMSGYQEVCTDPSYHGQIVVFTYPLIGNYGVNSSDVESWKPWVAGVVVREYCGDFSNWLAEGELNTFLEKAQVPGIMGVDTRALTRYLRDNGTMRGVISSYQNDEDIAEAVRRARGLTPISERSLAQEASTKEQYTLPPFDGVGGGPARRIAMIDCGIKYNILRSLRSRGLEVVVLPYDAKAQDVLALRPDGVFFSNGPGDPTNLPEAVECARKLLSAGLPMMGICQGHQIIGQAIGGTISRLRFGHHGGNHPVKDLVTGRVYITAQNHEYQVDAASVSSDSGFIISHINLNDNSVEGLAHQSLPIFSVQYHPEGSPGPQDSQYLFDRFAELTCAKERG